MITEPQINETVQSYMALHNRFPAIQPEHLQEIIRVTLLIAGIDIKQMPIPSSIEDVECDMMYPIGTHITYNTASGDRDGIVIGYYLWSNNRLFVRIYEPSSGTLNARFLEDVRKKT
jgi:hypothetical protein